MEVINVIKLSKKEQDAIDVLHSIDCSKVECAPKCPFYSKERLFLSTVEQSGPVTTYRYKHETESNCLAALMQHLAYKING